MNISILLILFMPLLYQLTAADCGCGIRCIKYSSADQCTRCCTATVRRSVPLQEPQQYSSNPIRVFDRELSKPVQNPSYYTIPRKSNNNYNQNQNQKDELIQLSNLISSIKQEEFQAKSRKRKYILQKTRTKLQHYRKLRREGIQESDSQEEMYDLLEMLLKKLRLRSQNSTRQRFERR
uniref:Uncharacterized protein n=1 Tax=Panagrolaimus superbus TaxID=310955 RepID=A0A914YH09_9BILA